jgi:hypothetical protein
LTGIAAEEPNMTDPKPPNASTDTPDTPRSQGQAGDLARGDPDRVEAFNGLTGGGQDGGGAYPNPHSGKQEAKGGGKDGFMGEGGQTEMPYHGTGQLGGTDAGGGNANAPAKAEKGGAEER